MNKKTYITPEMEIMNVEAMEMIASSLAMYGNEEELEAENQLGNRRRGTWGNFWAE